jgi:uncharacterized protein (TIGR00369 family)
VDTSEPRFEHFDPGVAKALVEASRAAGGLPGYLGVRITEVTQGRLLAELDVREELLTPFKNLHGGVMAALVDHVLGCVLYPLMQRGQWAATTEFKLNYLASVRAGRLLAESRVVAMTRRTAVVRVEVRNEGRLACAAQGTLLVVDRA